MDILHTEKKLLESYPNADIRILERYFGINVGDANDRLWILSMEILNKYRKATMLRGDLRKMETVQTGTYFKMIKSLGKGSFGEVWLAELTRDYKDFDKGDLVALKLINITKELDISKLNNEIGILKKLKIINGCKYASCYYDHFKSTTNRLVIVMDYVKGATLKRLIQTTFITGDKLRKIMTSALEGLNFLHTHNIVHRDIKPANMMVDGDKVKYIDFGFSCFTDTYSPYECEFSVIGTAAHMSPELLRTEEPEKFFDLYKSSDVWALGISFYQIIYNSLPYKASSKRAYSKFVVSDKPIPFPPKPNIDPKVINVIKGLLDKDPAARFTLEYALDILNPVKRVISKDNLLHEAAEKDDISGLKELLEIKNPNEVNTKGESPLYVAVINGNYDAIKLLLNAKADPNIPTNEGDTPLHEALLVCGKDIIRELLNAGADPSLKNKRGWSPLIQAIDKGCDVETLNFLLEKADPNITNMFGDTALIRAIVKGVGIDVIKTLIRGGADVNIANSNGVPPLHLAVIQDRPDVISELLKAGADRNKTDRYGATPVEIAERYNPDLKQLL